MIVSSEVDNNLLGKRIRSFFLAMGAVMFSKFIAIPNILVGIHDQMKLEQHQNVIKYRANKDLKLLLDI